MRIKQLSPYLANQIAAGEVIERPASVLKELLENSLDANANFIELEVEKGGLKQLRVMDNGEGIHKDDLLLAVSPHATSKLQTPDDLFNIHTLGFRGEALASIGSVARLQLSSCQDVAVGAFEIKVAGKDMSSLTPTAHPIGTTVLVEDLFFNTPARRKFLRSDKTEFNQVEEVFRRIVLSHYEVGFAFKHNQRQLYQLPAARNTLAQEKRIAKIFGANFLQNAFYIDFVMPAVKLWGWVGDAKYTRSQADLQYIYLNGRMIRDKLVNHALRSAYEDKLYPGRYPLFLLYLEIEPSQVDVNVHPTKHEVRFHDGRVVHDFLYQSVRETLSRARIKAEDYPAKASETAPNPEVNFSYEPVEIKAGLIAEPLAPSSYQTANALAMRSLGLIHEKYLLAEHPKGLLLVDLQQALFLLNQKHFLQAGINPKPLLIPSRLMLTDKQLQWIELFQGPLQAKGIQLNVLSINQLILRTIPNYLTKINAGKFLSLLVNELAGIKQTHVEDWNTLLAKIGSQAADLTQFDDKLVLAQLESLQQTDSRVCRLLSTDMLAKLLVS